MQRPALSTIALLLALCWSAPAAAQIYKCVEPASGRITFTDQPCTPGHTAAEIAVPEPNTVDSAGAREQILRREMEALRERLRAVEDARAQRSAADLQAERIDSFACADARRAYELEAGAFKQNTEAIDAKRAAMYGACGLREPDRVEIEREVIVPEFIRRPRWRDEPPRYPEPPPPRHTGRERVPATEPVLRPQAITR